MPTTLATRPLEPFGVEIDVDLTAPLDEAQQDALRELWRAHHLLVFRGQRLTLEQQARVVAYLGPVAMGSGDVPYVSNAMGDDGALGNMALGYHSDLSFCPTPFLGGALHAVEVVDGATSTRFANAILALADLPGGLRARVEGREARHRLGENARTGNQTSHARSDGPNTVHPVILRHPATGEDVLYVNEGQTECIVGMPADESEGLLRELFAHIYEPVHVYEHHWCNGDLVIYDNIALQHARDDVTGKGPRTLQRVTMAEKGFLELYPEFRTGQEGPRRVVNGV